MIADKHPAEVLAEQNETINDDYPARARVLMRAESARMLRTIPALEYERDQQAERLEKLLAENDLLLRHRNGAEAAARSAVHLAEGLEAERDRLQKANDGQTRLNITLVMENKELIAERDRLTAILERWADASAPDGWIGQMIVDRDQLRAEVQRWSVLAASFEAERNLLREEISDLHKANAARKQQ